MTVFKDKVKCCGCTACYNTCPKHCIEMKQDEEGFFYPVIDSSLCIHCNACVNSCPYNNEKLTINSLSLPEAYACIHNEKEIVKKSTSGGAFTAIIQSICTDNFVIFGATLDSNMNVQHTFITDLNDLDKFRSSKYVQSDLGNCLSLVKKFLGEGKNVIFTGTPCQIAGVKSFLKKDYENLITIDLVCHGVPSPLVFDEYKKYMEKKYRSKIMEINFRDKRNNWSEHNMTITFANSKVYSKRGVDDAFETGFYKHLYHRPSCHQCPFSRIPRIGDFTLGDLWGADEIIPEINNRKGVSLVLFNSNKSLEYKHRIATFSKLIKIDLNNAIRNNRNIISATQKSDYRNMFMNDMKTMNYTSLKKKYLRGRPLHYRIASKLFSKETKRKIKNIMKINN